MRTMMTVSFPTASANDSVRDGSMPKILGDTLERLKPEAAFFTTHNGLRTAYIVFDMKDASDMPSIAEPFFMGFNAGVSFSPVMNTDDLKAGLQKLQSAK